MTRDCEKLKLEKKFSSIQNCITRGQTSKSQSASSADKAASQSAYGTQINNKMITCLHRKPNEVKLLKGAMSTVYFSPHM